MMNSVTLRANGTLAAGSKPVTENPLMHLGHQLQLDPDCTLRSYFHLLDAYEPLTRLGDFFTILRRQYDQCPGSGCLWPEYSCLEFAKVVEMVGFPGDPRLDIYNAFQGRKGDTLEEIRSLPLAVLVDMPIRLGRLRHVIFGDSVDTFEFDTIYTLFEFIDGVAWELSFHGAPPECQIRS
jgi:hypothetical protein